ncbi:hypothetical protein DSM25558_3252 [Agrobacterium sp. DSM 25558]|nr:hypothetical protein DSM25558_3252 [Agrobacterium sp. DSM 25558]
MKRMPVNDDLSTYFDRLTGSRFHSLDERTAPGGAQTSRQIVTFKRQRHGFAIGRADKYAIPCPDISIQSDDLPETKIVRRRKIDAEAANRKCASYAADQYDPDNKDDEGVAAGVQRFIPGFCTCALACACACSF